MDELKQKEIEKLKNELDGLLKEIYIAKNEGIILDSGSIVPKGGHSYYNELEEKAEKLFSIIKKLEKE